MTTRNMTVALAVVTLSAVGLAMPAQSLTLKNLDRSEHKIVVLQGETQQEHTIAGQQELTRLCTGPCSIFIGSDSAGYELAAADKVEIENGELFYQEEAPETPKP